MIRFDHEKSRFMITAPSWNIGPVVRLPIRRFLKKANVWTAPATRLNAQHMLDTMGSWDWEPGARERAERAAATTTEQGRPWPQWFQFKTAPMAHQRRAIARAYSLDAHYLAMEQGTGKTFVVIATACAHRLHQKIRIALIVAPNCVIRTWEEQIAQHCPLPTRVWRMSSDPDPLQFMIPDNEMGFLLVSAESLSQGHAAKKLLAWMPGVPFLMYVDEAHYIKTPGKIRTENCIAIGRLAAVRLAGSGTQLTKSLSDLYSQYEYLDTNIIGLGDFYAFRNRYCIMGGFKRKEIIGYDHVDELMGFLRPYTFEILKKDCLDLPDKVYERRYVDLGPQHQKMYAALRKNALSPYQLPNVLVKTLRLRQLLAGLLPTEESELAHRLDPRVPVETYQAIESASNAKISALMADIEGLQGSMIIFTQWKKEVDQVARLLRPEWGEHVVFTGDLDPDVRQERIHAFQEGRARFFISTIDAGGIGITLTAASTVAFISHTDNFAKRLQAEDRAHRIGTRHVVTYLDYYANDTVDEALKLAHEQKQDLSQFLKERMRSASPAELEAIL